MNATHNLLTSPVAGHLPTKAPARSGAISVTLAPRFVQSLMLVGTWVGAGDALQAALSQHLGCAAPGKTGEVVQAPGMLVIRVGPEEFWVLENKQPDGGVAWRERIASEIGTVSDLSHARHVVQISGPAAIAVLGKLYALDFREVQFPVGQVRHTGHHHVPCLVRRLAADGFDIYLFSTYAHDALSSMRDAALEYGVEVLSDAHLV